MTHIYILLRNFDGEGWETYAITDSFENACAIKNRAIQDIIGESAEYMVEHWTFEDSVFWESTPI